MRLDHLSSWWISYAEIVAEKVLCWPFKRADSAWNIGRDEARQGGGGCRVKERKGGTRWKQNGRAYASNYVHRFTRKWEKFRVERDRLGRILLAGQVHPEAVEKDGQERGEGSWLAGVAFVAYARLAGHWHRSFTAWLTICPPRTAFGTEHRADPFCASLSLSLCRPPLAGCRRDVYYLN